MNTTILDAETHRTPSPSNKMKACSHLLQKYGLCMLFISWYPKWFINKNNSVFESEPLTWLPILNSLNSATARNALNCRMATKPPSQCFARYTSNSNYEGLAEFTSIVYHYLSESCLKQRQKSMFVVLYVCVSTVVNVCCLLTWSECTANSKSMNFSYILLM